MRKRVSLGELKDYCASNRPRQFSFYSTDQAWYNAGDPFKARISFRSMSIHESPGCVHLTNGKDVGVSLRCVQFAEIDTETLRSATILTLFCGPDGTPDIAKPYRFFVI